MNLRPKRNKERTAVNGNDDGPERVSGEPAPGSWSEQLTEAPTVVTRRNPRHNSQPTDDTFLVTQPNSHTENTQSGQAGSLTPTPETVIKDKKAKRHIWSREEYKEVMRAYYCAMQTGASKTEGTYTTWRQRNPTLLPELTPSGLADVRRNIEKKKWLTTLELDEVKRAVESTTQVDSQVVQTPPIVQEVEVLGEHLPEVEHQEPPECTSSPDDDMEQKIRLKLLELQSIGVKQRKGVNKFKKPPKIAVELLRAANSALANICKDEHLNLTELNQLMYAAAAVLS